MGTLRSEFEERYSEVRVVALTNPDKVASIINYVRLDAAVADAEAEFVDFVGVLYDGANARHIKSAVALVEVLLIEKGTGGISAASSLRERTESSLIKLSAASTTARQGIQVSGQDSYRSVKPCRVLVPWSDRYRWRGFVASPLPWTGNECP